MKTQATLTCPICKATQQAEIPDNSCVPFYKCEKCNKLVKAKNGDCCVFCSYGDQKCHLKTPLGTKKQERLCADKKTDNELDDDKKKIQKHFENSYHE